MTTDGRVIGSDAELDGWRSLITGPSVARLHRAACPDAAGRHCSLPPVAVQGRTSYPADRRHKGTNQDVGSQRVQVHHVAGANRYDSSMGASTVGTGTGGPGRSGG